MIVLFDGNLALKNVAISPKKEKPSCTKFSLLNYFLKLKKSVVIT